MDGGYGGYGDGYRYGYGSNMFGYSYNLGGYAMFIPVGDARALRDFNKNRTRTVGVLKMKVHFHHLKRFSVLPIEDVVPAFVADTKFDTVFIILNSPMCYAHIYLSNVCIAHNITVSIINKF